MTKPNIILMTDSYKYSHSVQYPSGTRFVESYVEARGDSDVEIVMFGCQAYIKEYLKGVVLEEWMIDEAAPILEAHGIDFMEKEWRQLLKDHKGRMPIRIDALPDGTVASKGVALAIMTNTDKNYFWLVSHLETSFLRAIWYPTTVATRSREFKKIIMSGLVESSDDPEGQIDFKLHDFGARGSTSKEGAELGGMAHLVNFKGTDTIEGLLAAKRYYTGDADAYSIAASEHSTMTSWGRENELAAYENMLDKYPTGIFACVSDSWDIGNATNLWGTVLKDRVMARDGTVVIRPDSGDPVITPVTVVMQLLDTFGYTVNSKGFKVLPPQIRVIQGDGLNKKTLNMLVDALISRKISIDNIAFGMGGGLLQDVNRDTYSFAMKCSAAEINKEWVKVYKDPIGGGKTSLRGRLDTVKSNDKFITVQKYSVQVPSAFDMVFLNGRMVYNYNFTEVRKRAKL